MLFGDETRMHRVKRPGQRLLARDVDRRVAELQLRLIRQCRSNPRRDTESFLNGQAALGIPVRKALG